MRGTRGDRLGISSLLLQVS